MLVLLINIRQQFILSEILRSNTLVDTYFWLSCGPCIQFFWKIFGNNLFLLWLQWYISVNLLVLGIFLCEHQWFVETVGRCISWKLEEGNVAFEIWLVVRMSWKLDVRCFWNGWKMEKLRGLFVQAFKKTFENSLLQKKSYKCNHWDFASVQADD